MRKVAIALIATLEVLFFICALGACGGVVEERFDDPAVGHLILCASIAAGVACSLIGLELDRRRENHGGNKKGI